MESIVRDVRDLDTVDREALERLVGQRLCENQQIIIDVVNLDGAAASPNEAQQPAAQSEPQIPEWVKIYEGLSDEEIDRLDEAIRQRADLTRQFE